MDLGTDPVEVMMGHLWRGIKTGATPAFYANCKAQCCNSVLVDAVKAVPEADFCFFFTTEALCVHVWVLCSSRRLLGDAKLLSDTLRIWQRI